MNHNIEENIKRPHYTAVAKPKQSHGVATTRKLKEGKQIIKRMLVFACCPFAVQDNGEITVYFCRSAVATLRNLSCKWDHVTCASQDRLASEKGPRKQKMKEKEEEKGAKEEKVSVEI